MSTHFHRSRRVALALAAAWPLAASAFDVHRLFGVKGSGRIARQPIDVGEFDGIELAGDVVCELSQNQPPRVMLEVDDNLLPLIEVTVKDRSLRLRKRESMSPTRLRLVVDVWRLERIVLSGSSTLRSDKLVAKSLSLRVSGSGALRLPVLTAETLLLQAGGSGVIDVGGQANELSASLGGSGVLDASKLQVRRVSVALGGSAVATVWATDDLSGKTGGSSVLRYRGEPRVSVGSGGSSRVVHKE